MFARLYLVIGLFALIGFAYAQHRGTSPFDTYANTTSGSGSSGARSGSHTYHK